MRKFMIYNAEGLTIPVEAELGVPFYFDCPEEECGKRVVIEGRIRAVSLDEFDSVVENVIREDPSFRSIENITVRKYVFEGRVNGRGVVLPAESLEDFAKRFVESLDTLIVLR
jgi:hypothetical protein